MKVLLLTTHLEIGGIPVYVVSLARGLKQRGFFPIVVSAGGRLEERLTREGIPHYRLLFRTSSELNPVLWFRAFPALLRLVRRERPVLLHAHTRIAQVLGWALHIVTRLPFMTTCHGLYKFRIGRRFFRCWGSRVIAISDATLERLVLQYRLAPPHQVVLVPNGVETDWFGTPAPVEAVERYREALGLAGGPVIGSISRLSPVKGLDLLLKAAAALLPDFPDLKVLLVGEGSAREGLVKLAYTLGMADRVVIGRPVEDTRVPMAAMDLFVSAALQEGFGLSIVEAMAAGLPVVVTDAGGPAEIVEWGRCGLLVSPGDPVALAEGIRKLLGDDARRGEFARAGRVRAAKLYDFNRVTDQVIKVYEEVVA